MLAWQLDVAKALGCEKIACLVEHNLPFVQDVARAAERDGIEFLTVNSGLDLVGVVSADHEILVMCDGIIIDQSLVVSVLGTQRGVAAVPASSGIAAGLERIDAEHAWAGILVARGAIVERLADLPPDSDVISLLLRLALQSGAKPVALGEKSLKDSQVLLALDEGAVLQRETALLNEGIDQSEWIAPGDAVAKLAARAMAPAMLSKGPTIVGGGGLALMVVAVGLAHQSLSAAALLTLGVGLFALTTAQTLARLRNRLAGRSTNRNISITVKALVDTVLIAVLALPMTLTDASERLYLPVLLIGLLRLAELLAPERAQPLLSDRVTLSALLAVSAVLGVIPQTIAALTLIVLAASLIFRVKLR